MRGNNACVSPIRLPGASSPLFRVFHECGDGLTPTISRMRSPVPGMNGRTSSPITRTVSAATYKAVSSSSRFAASFASTHGSRVTIYRFVAPITSQISRSAWLNWNDSTAVLTRPMRLSIPLRSSTSGARASKLVARPRDDALAVAMNDRGRPADEVAEIVGQVGVVPPQHGFVREVGVLAEHHLAHDEVSEAVHAELPDVVGRLHDVANRLGHLGAVHQPPAVADQPAGMPRSAAIRNAGQ